MCWQKYNTSLCTAYFLNFIHKKITYFVKASSKNPFLLELMAYNSRCISDIGFHYMPLER